MSPIVRDVSGSALSVAAGAAVMYWLDPERGRRRRSLAEDQLRSAATQLRKSTAATVRDARNRAQGLVAEARSGLGLRPREAGDGAPPLAARLLEPLRRGGWSDRTRLAVGLAGGAVCAAVSPLPVLYRLPLISAGLAAVARSAWNGPIEPRDAEAEPAGGAVRSAATVS